MAALCRCPSPEPARSQPAQVITELSDDRGLAHASCLHRRRDPARGPAIDAQVGLDDLRGVQTHQR